MDGQYKSGDRLPSEGELAEVFHAGRGTVREALKALAMCGLVRVERGRGTFVSTRDGFLTHPLSLGFKPETEFRELVEARLLVEVELAGLAAARGDEKGLAEIRHHLDRMIEVKAPEHSHEYLEADVGFHFAIARAAHNSFLSRFLTVIRNLMQEWILLSLRLPGSAQEAIAQHEKIYEALSRHDVPAAREAMRRHLERMGERLYESSKTPDLGGFHPRPQSLGRP
jgi:DNA-binding FadR family transcriptional regulator